MRVTFIETLEFTEWLGRYLTDEGFAALQRDLMADPKIGTVMPGCGGLRKVRVADEGRAKGKRGGARVVYLQVPRGNVIYFITIYGKDQKDDLSHADKSLFRQLAAILKGQPYPEENP